MIRFTLPVLVCVALLSSIFGHEDARAQDAVIIATFDVLGEQFHVLIENPTTIEQVRALEAGESSATIPNGALRAGPDGNQPWSWHLDPVDIEMAEITTEVCDGTPSMVEQDLDYWINTVGRFCPWQAVLVSVQDVSATPTAIETSPTPAVTVTPAAVLPDTGHGTPREEPPILLFAIIAGTLVLSFAGAAARGRRVR